MGSKMIFSVISSLLLFVYIVQAQPTVFDVTKYGAVADEKTDLNTALLDAWKEACAATGSSKVTIPAGTYLLGLIELLGPCKGAMELEVLGTVKAPADLSGDSWITFNHIDQLAISGGGTFDGQGEAAWKGNDCREKADCKPFPVSLRFNFVTNGIVHDVTSLNSKNFHVNVLGCQNITFQKFTVTAPEDSTNTDGIHIGRSKEVNITETNIGTGDDCISVGDGTQNLRITKVTCGPGHGISVGSLGKYENEEPVSGIFVINCTIKGATNGVRVKSWPARNGGTASDMHFEDIIMDNVQNPVLIDQMYCPWNQCNDKEPSKVKISDVSFKNIRGTSATALAVKLMCSSGIPCENVELAEIDLAYSGSEGPAKSECTNVKPTITGTFNPAGCSV